MIRQYSKYLLLIAATTLLLQGCSSKPPKSSQAPSPIRDSGPLVRRDMSHVPDAVPRHEPQTRAGNPPTYVVFGQHYTLLDSNDGYVERGYASWYGKKFHGRTTSNGEIYDMFAMTAAHRTLRIPAYVQVTNLRNGRQVVVRVNDRGPFVGGRIIDLSYAAASRLGFVQEGIAPVEVRIVMPGDRLPTAAEVMNNTVNQPSQASTAAHSPTNYPASNTTGSPAPIETTAVATGPSLYLQMGSFVSRDNAEGLRSRLVAENIQGAHIQQFQVDRQEVFRVRVGPLASSEEADRLALEINRLGMGVPRIVVD